MLVARDLGGKEVLLGEGNVRLGGGGGGEDFRFGGGGRGDFRFDGVEALLW